MIDRIILNVDIIYGMSSGSIRSYSQKLLERVSLSQNGEFRAVRNAVIKAAAEPIGVEMDGITSQDEDTAPAPSDELPEFESSFPGQDSG